MCVAVNRIPFVAIVVMALASCNGDLFVPNVRPDKTQVLICGDGGRVAVGFHPAGLLGVSLEGLYGKCGDYYDETGEPISSQQCAARIVYETQWLMFCLHIDGDKLIFESVENASGGSYTFILRLEYEYVTECVELTVLPGALPRLVDVSYYDSVVVENDVKASTVDVDNQSGSSMTMEAMPYRSISASVLVSPQETWASNRHVIMTLPEYSGGRWRLGEERRVEIGVKYDYPPSSAAQDLVVPVEIPPYTICKVITEVTYSAATASGVLTFENPVSGRLNASLFTCRVMETVDHEVYVL